VLEFKLRAIGAGYASMTACSAVPRLAKPRTSV
jgi:hypothetical protein